MTVAKFVLVLTFFLRSKRSIGCGVIDEDGGRRVNFSQIVKLTDNAGYFDENKWLDKTIHGIERL